MSAPHRRSDGLQDQPGGHALSDRILGGRAPRRLEFHVIYRCVNSCVFCSEREHMRQFAKHPAEFADIAEVLKRKREEGCEHVTFTGGEPTLHPRIWDALSLAKELGYKTFMISNGSAFALREMAERVLPHLDELCLSVHGHETGLHTGLTGNPKSFERMLETLENVQKHPKNHFVMVNTVVTRRNIKHLPDILRLVSRYKKVRHYLASQLAPEGEGLKRYEELVVRHEEIAAQLPKLLKIAKPEGIAVRVFGVPVCSLGRNWRCANDLYFSPRVTVARAWTSDGRAGWFEEPGLLPTRERFFPEICSGCAIKGRCGGVFKIYWDRMGEKNLKPFKDAPALEPVS